MEWSAQRLECVSLMILQMQMACGGNVNLCFQSNVNMIQDQQTNSVEINTYQHAFNLVWETQSKTVIVTSTAFLRRLAIWYVAALQTCAKLLNKCPTILSRNNCSPLASVPHM
jgi:hypothetical protein